MEAGERAEEVANWYFRLNGFLGIPSFVVHPDVRQRNPRTEADFIGVRFGASQEFIDKQVLQDHGRLTACSRSLEDPIPLFVIAEVTTGDCKINGPFTRPEDRNMERVLQRLGGVPTEEIEQAATSLYKTGKWEDDYGAVQFVSIGRAITPQLSEDLPKLLQVTWMEVAQFLYERFAAFPPKLPSLGTPVHRQWPAFGSDFGKWFSRTFGNNNAQSAFSAIERYFETGSCA